jgi:hypothetical protein
MAAFTPRRSGMATRAGADDAACGADDAGDAEAAGDDRPVGETTAEPPLTQALTQARDSGTARSAAPRAITRRRG